MGTEMKPMDSRTVDCKAEKKRLADEAMKVFMGRMQRMMDERKELSDWCRENGFPSA